MHIQSCCTLTFKLSFLNVQSIPLGKKEGRIDGKRIRVVVDGSTFYTDAIIALLEI